MSELLTHNDNISEKDFYIKRRLAELSPETRKEVEASMNDPNGLHMQLKLFCKECEEEIRLIKIKNNGIIPPLMFMGKVLDPEAISNHKRI
ncbi:Hypothetical protein HVR_LOCUS1043 [uncultured virus]|nr:Hypothetical protein HVR_LOCUS1043 [uncultured virus]